MFLIINININNFFFSISLFLSLFLGLDLFHSDNSEMMRQT
jgi:hypothetical protein